MDGAPPRMPLCIEDLICDIVETDSSLENFLKIMAAALLLCWCETSGWETGTGNVFFAVASVE